MSLYKLYEIEVIEFVDKLLLCDIHSVIKLRLKLSIRDCFADKIMF
jgi:hypothetical protein